MFMKHYRLLYIFMILFILFLSTSAKNPNYSVRSVSFDKVLITDSFWSSYLKAHATNILPTCIAQMEDSTQRINNFMKAAGLKDGQHEGIYFDDSDVYKAMEGISYSLMNNPNPKYEALLDRWIDFISKSQRPDGYLNTYFTLKAPEKRWTDMEKHEMYCGGHMIEAAVAHHKATGKETFLNVATRYADHLDNTFGPGKRHWVPGHEEIELALVKLYHETNKKKYLDLANWLLEERGHGYGRGEIWEKPQWGAKYCQDDVPVSEITDIKGHAVRAMYLFTGMADVAAEKGLSGYAAALNRVWDDVVMRNMYITGGIGSSLHNEGFTQDYDLPNKEAYCETCASIGMVFWNNRMNLLSKDAKYVDVMERCIYNGVLSGMSLKGDLFFYVNPLESEGNHHRQRWFGCACCPSNISRFIPSIGNYIYLAGENEVFVNLFLGNEATMKIHNQDVRFIQQTNYPWDGQIQIEVKPSKAAHFSVKLRVPDWCKNYDLSVNGRKIRKLPTEKGYVDIVREWVPGDKINLELAMPIELVAADPRVKEDIGKRAIQRGPVVYCAEQVDNKNVDFDHLFIEREDKFETIHGKNILSAMTLIESGSNAQKLTLIPYFAWDNRDAGKMKVWMDYREK